MASPRLRDRSRLRSTHKAKQLHQYEVRRKNDPDYELVHVSPSPAMYLSRNDYHSMDQGRGLAFAHLETSVDEEETLYAGMSSAAACIVLELPRHPALTPRENPFKVDSNKRGDKRGRKNQTIPPSIKDMHSWRDAMSWDSHRFKPVYTHRFFVGERMKGYRPTERAEEEVMAVLPEGAELHESFSYHVSARYELSVQVRLAPSCRKSCVIITVGKVSQPPASIVSHMNQVRQALALSEVESQPEVINLVSEDDYEHTSATSKKRSRRSNNVLPQRKSCRTKANQTSASTVTRRSTRRVQIQVSSDESEDESPRSSSFVQQALAPIATRRSGRRCAQTSPQSKRSLFSVNESEESLSHSSDELSASDGNKSSARQHNNQFIQCETPTLTRSMSSQSNDSMLSCTSTGDIKLDGGKMRVETIVKHLIRGLPNVEGILLFDGDHYSAIGEDGGPKSLSATVKSIDAVESDYLDQPVGTAIREYSKSKRAMSLQGSGGITPLSRESDSSDNAPFLLSLADMRTDNKARQYHDQLEKLAPWWIETADCVGMGLTEGVNETGGHWKVLYLFEKHNTKSPAAKRGVGRSKSQKAKPPIAKYSLAGYMTLWFQGKNMVVCQVLLLPPYQRSGHGTELLRAAYDLAFAKCGADSMDTVSQIDVELPGKAFVALRNRLDYDLFSEAIKISHTPYSLIPSEYAKPIDLSAPRDQYITPLPDDIVSKVASKLKITRRQVQVASEIWLLSEIDKRIEDLAASTSNSHISSRQIVFLEACYESIVRRSLLQVMRANNEEKFRFLTIDEQKDALESSFKATVAHYRSILG